MSGIAAYSTLHAAGADNQASWQAVSAGRSGLRPNALAWCSLPTWLGEVAAANDARLPAGLEAWDCRTHRLAWLALQSAELRQAAKRLVEHYGASRIGVILGTSTAGIRSTEMAYREWRAHEQWPAGFDYRHTHALDALCRFSATVLGLQGPMLTVSTACSSSAKAFVMAQRWIDCGLIDAALVGGVDSLCESTLHGFNALQIAAISSPLQIIINVFPVFLLVGLQLIPVAGPRMNLESGSVVKRIGSVLVGYLRVVARVAVAESFREDLIPDHAFTPLRSDVGLGDGG